MARSIRAPEPQEGVVPFLAKKTFRAQRWMEHLLEVSLSPECPDTLEARCNKIGIGVSKWHYWCRKPAFVAWWNEQVEKRVDAGLGQAHLTTLKRAIEGRNPAYTKLLYERFDKRYVPTQKNLIVERPPPLVITMGEEKEGLLSRLPKTDKGNAVIEAAPAKALPAPVDDDEP